MAEAATAEPSRFARFATWLKGPPRPPNPPPEWVFRRLVAFGVFVAVIVVAATPAGPAALVAWPLLAVQVYEDRRANGMNQAWPSVVATLGPVAFPFYVRARRKLLAGLAAASPPAKAADGTELESGAERPADWYADPLGRTRIRYWNGLAWTSFSAR